MISNLTAIMRRLSLVVIVTLSLAGWWALRTPKTQPTSPPRGIPSAEPTAASTAAYLGGVIFARDVSGTLPVGAANRFDAGIKAIYAFFDFDGLKPEDTVAAVWYDGTDTILEQHVRVSEILGTNPREYGHLWLSIQFEQGAPAGSYVLELRVNEAFAQSANFSVGAL